MAPDPGVLGGSWGWNDGELVVQGLGSPWCFHPPPPARPSSAALPDTARLQKQDCGTPEPDPVTSCQHKCGAAFERYQVTTKVSVLSKGMAPGTISVEQTPTPALLDGAGSSSTPSAPWSAALECR